MQLFDIFWNRPPFRRYRRTSFHFQPLPRWGDNEMLWYDTRQDSGFYTHTHRLNTLVKSCTWAKRCLDQVHNNMTQMDKLQHATHNDSDHHNVGSWDMVIPNIPPWIIYIIYHIYFFILTLSEWTPLLDHGDRHPFCINDKFIDESIALQSPRLIWHDFNDIFSLV